MKVSLRSLRYVVETAELGSVTEAARRLNISQPSISAALAQVEAELGVRLFVRHHARGMTLSAAGQRFVNEARLLLSHARDFAERAEALGDAQRGEIAVGSLSTLASRFMPAVLAGFSERHPQVSVRLEDGDQQTILEGISSGRTEIALSYEYTLPDEIVGERLATLPPCVLLSARHPLAARRQVSLLDLREEPFILLDLPFARDYFFALFGSLGIEPRVAFRSRSYELIRGLVGHGRGYTLHNAVPRSTFSEDGSPIAVLTIGEALQPAHVTSLRLRRAAIRPVVRLFDEYLRAAFGPGGMFEPGSLGP